MYALAAAGRWPDVRALLDSLRLPDDDRSSGIDRAYAELVFGDPGPLVRLLSTSEGQRQWWDVMGGFGCSPMLDPLWTDPRFRRSMRTLGIRACPKARPSPLRLPNTGS